MSADRCVSVSILVSLHICTSTCLLLAPLPFMRVDRCLRHFLSVFRLRTRARITFISLTLTSSRLRQREWSRIRQAEKVAFLSLPAPPSLPPSPPTTLAAVFPSLSTYCLYYCAFFCRRHRVRATPLCHLELLLCRLLRVCCHVPVDFHKFTHASTQKGHAQGLRTATRR